MTAQPADAPGGQPWRPDPRRQRLADHTIEDVLDLPDDAGRVELSDGVMHVVPSPSLGHQDIGHLLWAWFRHHAPAGLRPGGPAGVAVTLKTTFEPDLLLYRAELATDRHYLAAEDVMLVVEVVSPGTRRRDRLEKPAGYADAGIPYYWRIEQDPVHVFAYRLVNGAYQLQADSTTELVLDEPFEIKLPIVEITP
jgi:Uma2 family endonuclease